MNCIRKLLPGGEHSDGHLPSKNMIKNSVCCLFIFGNKQAYRNSSNNEQFTDVRELFEATLLNLRPEIFEIQNANIQFHHIMSQVFATTVT